MRSVIGFIARLRYRRVAPITAASELAGRFLRRVGADAAAESAVPGPLAGELAGVGGRLRMWCAVGGVVLDGDGRRADRWQLRQLGFQCRVLRFARGQAQGPAFVVDG